MKKFNLTLFAATGAVYPVHNNKFTIGILGRASIATFIVLIRGIESFSPAVDSNVETWTPLDEEGWSRNAITGKGLTISLSGKRQVGDPGNDYIASLMMGTGSAVESKFEWEFPSGAKLAGDCVINVSTVGGGDATGLDGIECEILCDGKPTFTAAPVTP